MRRREFVTGCGRLAGLAAMAASWPGALEAAARGTVEAGPRAQLVLDDKASPLRASALRPHRNYVFLYPNVGTPCFLLDLGRPVTPASVETRATAGPYAWAGGVGRNRSIVAYSAICPHTYAHPTRDVALIHYFGPDAPATVAQRGGVITCCVHGSTFDPARGGVPLQPPAELPLAAVALEWDKAADALHAVGIVGRPVFQEFYQSFPQAARRPVEGTTRVWELERYSSAVLPC
jgi:Rieske Fe-S protein